MNVVGDATGARSVKYKTKPNSKEKGNRLFFIYLPIFIRSADQSRIAVSEHKSLKSKQTRDPLVCDPDRWGNGFSPS